MPAQPSLSIFPPMEHLKVRSQDAEMLT